MSNIFDRIHRLLKDNLNDEAIVALLSKRSRLRKEFWIDKNHAWYCVGCAYFNNEEYDLARKAFMNALRYAPFDTESLLACANCFSEMQRPDDVLRILKKALRQNPGGKLRTAIKYNLGNAFFDLKRYEEAKQIYMKLSKRNDEIGHLAKKNIIHLQGKSLEQKINS